MKLKLFRGQFTTVAMASAAGGAATNADEQTIREAFKSKLPGAQVISVEKLRYADLYEVAVKGSEGYRVFYTDAQGQVMLIGDMIETRTDRNPIEELVALGRRLGATRTPTWFLPNGEKYFGPLPMSEVVPLLDTTARRQ